MVQQKLVSSEKTNEKEKICRDELSSKLNHNEWKEYQLKEIATINPKTGEIPKKFCYIDLESVQSGLLMSKKIIHSDEAPSRAQRVLKPNDILYQTVRPYQKNNLFFEFTDMDYVASTGYAQIRTNKLCTPEFLYYLLHTEKFVNNVLARCTGTSYPAINSNDLKKIKVKVPEIPIQMKIENILISIDKKIELLEKKLVLYQQLEKDIRKSIFNFNNEKIRFNKFLLGEIAEIKKGFTPSTQNEKFWDDGKYFWLSIADMNKKYLTETSKKITEKAIKNKEIVPKNTLVMSFKLTIGKLAILKEDMFTNEAIASFNWKNKKISTEYMYFYLKSINIKKYGSQAAKGITLNNETLNSIPVYLPDSNKQKEIVEILLSFNNKIDLVKTQLTALNRFKKGLLQKMFI